ncbi:MAG TPA: class I SAM-dependent methyltransferase [Gaiellaceae bacterium]|nr:class I SAM-dependent methyltransferase [Gaiellaceae bacterium]
MSGPREVDRALLHSAGLEPDDDVLVLGAGDLAFDVHELVGDGWVYVVRAQVDELEELLAEAHAGGRAGVAYLMGEAPVLPLPDNAVAAAVGRLAADEGALEAAARELARVVQAGGRVALAEADARGGEVLGDALAAAGFTGVVSQAVAEERVVAARLG